MTTRQTKAKSRVTKTPPEIFLVDLDGTLTDGGRYVNSEGAETKKFYVPDGLGLVCLNKLGVKTGLITTETGPLVDKRAESLQLTFRYFGCSNKMAAAQEIEKRSGISLKKMAFIGDDINDYDLLCHVGYAACPRDAQDLIKRVPKILHMSKNGGQGAVREFINLLYGETELLKIWRSIHSIGDLFQGPGGR